MSLFQTYLESSKSNNLHSQFKNENPSKDIFIEIHTNNKGGTKTFYSDNYVEWLEKYCKFLEGTD